jgi:hypothetical protein
LFRAAIWSTHLRAGLRPRLEHGRGLHRPAAQEAATRADRNRARPWLSSPRNDTMNMRRTTQLAAHPPAGRHPGLDRRLDHRCRLGLSSLFHQHVEAQFHAELQDSSRPADRSVHAGCRGLPSLALPLSDPRLSRPYSGCYWQIDQTHDGNRGAETGGCCARARCGITCSPTPPDTPADGEIHQHRSSDRKARCLAWSNAVCASTTRPMASPAVSA